jgi:hypothetical protein
MKKVLKILTPNRKLNYRGRQIRTPVSIVSDEKEINTILVQLRLVGCTKFSIEPYHETKPKNTTEQKIKEPVIEKIDEPLTILEKLLKTKE